MGYHTDFWGSVEVNPPLNAEEISYLQKFNETRRMACTEGPYFVDRPGPFGQDHTPSVIDYNTPPEGQPGLWCHWQPNHDGTAIEWDGGEKFYAADDWMKYLIDHFIGSTPLAREALPFLQGHTCNGTISAQGESGDDRYDIIVTDNKVTVQDLEFQPSGSPREV